MSQEKSFHTQQLVRVPQKAAKKVAAKEEDCKEKVQSWNEVRLMARPGLYANIHAKRKRIAAGSGEKMRKPGTKGAPTAKQFRKAALTAKAKGKKEN